MKQQQLRSYLEIATNVAVLLVAVALLMALVTARLSRHQAPKLESGFHRGDVLPRLSSVDYSAAPQTMLIAMNTRCSYCKESLPFYKQLGSEQRKGSYGARIVAVFPNTETEVEQYKQQNPLDLETLANVDFRSLNIAGTPTIILADSSGRVRDFWIGLLSKDDEEQVLKTIRDRNSP